MLAASLQIFLIKKMPKGKVPCKCLSIMILNSAIKANKKCYPQTFLEECKYTHENKNYIDVDLKKSKSDSASNDETESDIHNDNDKYDK